MSEALTFVEIDIGYCALTFGVAPCQASITDSPADDIAKCFNTRQTCQDIANFDEGSATLRFAKATKSLPREIDIVGPWIESVEYSPAALAAGENLGQRASVKVVFTEHRHSDAGAGLDKYQQQRISGTALASGEGYDPYERGTFWARLRARHPSLRGRALRLIMGFVGDALADMETRHFWIESFEGPTPDGKFSITAKDALKFLDGDRAQAPALSNGFLVAEIDDNDTDATLSPSGIGDEEYSAGGYVNIGGNEIAKFSRDPYTKALLHFEGDDAATETADTDVANPHAVTFNGSAQIDTGQFKFGESSLQLGAAGNYISLADSDDWFLGTGNFTIDVHCRFTTVPSGAPNGTFDGVLFWQQVDANNVLIVYFDGTRIEFWVMSGGVQLAYYHAPHGMTNATWHHWRFVRSGTSFFIFRDGVSLTLTTVTAIGSSSLPNLAVALKIGGQTAPGPDWLAEFRWRKGIADTVVNFTAPTSPLTLIGSGDAIRLTRGQLGTVASSHDVQDRVQVCLRFEAVSPDEIIADLIEGYTDLDPDYIDNDAWASEVSTNLNRVYTGTVAEPTSVAKLVSEVIEQAALALWDDNEAQQLRLQVLRGIVTDADSFDESNVLRRDIVPFTLADQPEKRVSRVHVHFGLIDPTKRVDDPNNYRSTAEVKDEDLEVEFGSPAIRKVFSRWIPQFGRTIAERLGAIMLGRYGTPPRKFGFGVLRGNVTVPMLGAGYRLQWFNLQEADGAREDVPIQIIRLLPDAAKIKVDAEEFRFDAPAEDLANRVITIDFNINNLNWKAAHDSVFPEIESGQTATLIIAAGIIVGSDSAADPALDVGTWPAGVTLNVEVIGRTQGAGGHGGHGGVGGGGAGTNGGTALFTRHPVNLDVDEGEIWGGGGGGGGGAGTADTYFGGSGGGGGGGSIPGTGGPGGSGIVVNGSPGSPGNTESAGPGGLQGADGGNGGNPGINGFNGQSTPGIPGGSGGTAGAAIDGISFVTVTQGPGDIRGSQIN